MAHATLRSCALGATTGRSLTQRQSGRARHLRAGRRRAMTLLELVMATTLLTTLVTAVALVLRTGHTAWTAHEEDATQLEAAHATLRHLVRQIRQATAVTGISPPSSSSGTLSLLMPAGSTLVWTHDPTNSEVRFGVDQPTDLLATGITQLNFTAYQADGATEAATLAGIRSIVCRAQVELPHDAGGTRSISCRAWIRTW